MAGGILGAPIGGGSGQILATGTGIAISAMAGGAIGSSMDCIDRMKTEGIDHMIPEFNQL